MRNSRTLLFSLMTTATAGLMAFNSVGCSSDDGHRHAPARASDNFRDRDHDGVRDGLEDRNHDGVRDGQENGGVNYHPRDPDVYR